jgi:hypothetical protein
VCGYHVVTEKTKPGSPPNPQHESQRSGSVLAYGRDVVFAGKLRTGPIRRAPYVRLMVHAPAECGASIGASVDQGDVVHAKDNSRDKNVCAISVAAPWQSLRAFTARGMGNGYK